MLLLLQVLVFNHIHIMGYATPLPFCYLLLILHSETARWVYVGLGFLLGLAVDICSNTIGECSAAGTLLGLVTPHLLNAFSPADRSDDGFLPSATTMKWGGFMKYAFAAALIVATTTFVLEWFSVHNLEALALHVGGSTLLTFVILCAMERIRKQVVKP